MENKDEIIRQLKIEISPKKRMGMLNELYKGGHMDGILNELLGFDILTRHAASQLVFRHASREMLPKILDALAECRYELSGGTDEQGLYQSYKENLVGAVNVITGMKLKTPQRYKPEQVEEVMEAIRKWLDSPRSGSPN
jgi:hypothetical protein